MIKLKDLLKEYTMGRFSPPKESNQKEALEYLKDWGFKKSAKSNKKMVKWIAQYKGYPMSTHVQYHELLKDDPADSTGTQTVKRIRLHQQQYYGSHGPFNPDLETTVGTTLVQIVDLSDDKIIGSVVVETDDFLDELRKGKFKITKKAS